MSHIKKGILVAEAERCKHLRRWLRSRFWRRHRREERRETARILAGEMLRQQKTS